MTLQFLSKDFTIFKAKEMSDVGGEFLFIGKTDAELSIVCETKFTPESTLAREDGWIAFRIAGQLEFSLTGILSPIAAILADEKIGIFAVSTYDTDYVLIKKENELRAQRALENKGYIIEKM